MSKIMNLEDLSNYQFEEQTITETNKSSYSHYSKNVSIIIGYLLGVSENSLKSIPNTEDEYFNLKLQIEKNECAVVIRQLNNIRSNIILGFKDISRKLRDFSSDYKPLYQMEPFKDNFKILNKLNINIITGRQDLNEYISITNKEIMNRIDRVKPLFPEWIEFKHIKAMFNMGTNIESESKKFLTHQSYYPYQRYFHWTSPSEQGNILLSDVKLLDIIYYSNGSYFEDINRVVDATDNVKDNIYEFIKRGRKIQIFIDGENCDPYQFVSAIDSLNDEEINKIDKIIVYYDKMHSCKAWERMKHFVLDIEIETIAVERIKEDKSLVDHKLVAGVSKAVYQDNVDSIILASSDSDFWAVIEDVPAKYLVMIETDKCGFDFKEILREHDIFYCYLDKFKTPEDNKFFKMVFKSELQDVLNNVTSLKELNAYSLLDTSLIQSRASISNKEKENIFNTYIKNLNLVMDKNGNFTIQIPEG